MSVTASEHLLPDGPGADVRIDPDLPHGTLPMLQQLFRDHGDIFKLKTDLRDDWIYVISHPDMVSHVLGRNYRNYVKGIGIDRVNVLLGKGLIVSEGEVWKRQRRMIQPMFHSEMLERFSATMVRCSERLLADWQRRSGDDCRINLTDEMSRITLEFVLYMLFSEDLDELVSEQGHNPFFLVTDDSSRDLMFARKFRALSTLVAGMMEKRRTQARRPFDLLSMLLDARDKTTGEPMPDRLLIDEVMTMIVAGHETTAATLNWAWYLLATHPQCEARLHQELERVLGGRTPQFEDLASLEYTRQVLLESMRLYPPVWLFTRRALGEDTLGGYHVAAGTDLFISPYIVHRHPQFWEQPEQFMPERFERAREAERPRGAYIPFSMGARNCIGETMALYEMMIHLGLIAQHLRLEFVADKPVELDPKINLRTRHDMHMLIKARHG